MEDKVARRVEWHATDASTASILADVVHWLCALRATEGEAPTHLDRLAHVVARWQRYLLHLRVDSGPAPLVPAPPVPVP